MMDQRTAGQRRAHGADGRLVRAVDCRRGFSRIFGARHSGYSRFNRTLPLPAAAAVDWPGATADGSDP
jgi:hypothetical protein